MDSFERDARRRGYAVIAGIDEAGRGPLAGPVIAAAVILPPEYRNGDIRDSKVLSPSKRDVMFEVIRRDALSIGVGASDHVTIDSVNILRATIMAMEQAVSALAIPPDFILIDGTHGIPVPIPQKTIIGGDTRSVSVAAASIVAKVTRDRMMQDYHLRFPRYNFLKNKGYGTREHRLAIQQYGFCSIHRKTFTVKPCREK